MLDLPCSAKDLESIVMEILRQVLRSPAQERKRHRLQVPVNKSESSRQFKKHGFGQIEAVMFQQIAHCGCCAMLTHEGTEAWNDHL